jgi:integrase/recombinase XerD
LTVETARVLAAWLSGRAGQPDDPVFSTSRGRPLSPDAVALVVTRHTNTAQQHCPTLASKTVSPHTLRHTAAMRLLEAGVDSCVIALWLGHESVETTQVSIHADLRMKEQALARTAPTHIPSGRYQAPDSLIAFLEAL